MGLIRHWHLDPCLDLDFPTLYFEVLNVNHIFHVLLKLWWFELSGSYRQIVGMGCEGFPASNFLLKCRSKNSPSSLTCVGAETFLTPALQSVGELHSALHLSEGKQHPASLTDGQRMQRSAAAPVLLNKDIEGAPS